jgi:hypothetical protein
MLLLLCVSDFLCAAQERKQVRDGLTSHTFESEHQTEQTHRKHLKRLQYVQKFMKRIEVGEGAAGTRSK